MMCECQIQEWYNSLKGEWYFLQAVKDGKYPRLPDWCKAENLARLEVVNTEMAILARILEV